MDFIKKLLLLDRNINIMVVMDRLSKDIIFKGLPDLEADIVT